MKKVQPFVQLNRKYRCKIGNFLGGENYEKLQPEKLVQTNFHLHFIPRDNTVKRSGDIFITLALTENRLLKAILIRQYFCMGIIVLYKNQ